MFTTNLAFSQTVQLELLLATVFSPCYLYTSSLMLVYVSNYELIILHFKRLQLLLTLFSEKKAFGRTGHSYKGPIQLKPVIRSRFAKTNCLRKCTINKRSSAFNLGSFYFERNTRRKAGSATLDWLSRFFTKYLRRNVKKRAEQNAVGFSNSLQTETIKPIRRLCSQITESVWAFIIFIPK